MDEWESARRMIREYGKEAEDECLARASYHNMQGDKEVAEQWKRVQNKLAILRLGGN